MLKYPGCVAATRSFSGIIDGLDRRGEGARLVDGMRVICASCRVEGRSGDLGEKAPFDDPTETHGYCARHAAQLLASLPSRSFPDAEMLLVVRRHDPTLFEYLQRRLVGVRGVQVILERRQGDRRREARPPAKDRRRVQRRLRHGQMSSLGYTSVRFRVIPSAGP